MANSLAPLALAAALATGNTQAESNKNPDFSGLMESHNPAVEQVIHNTQTRMAPLAETVLMAQASQETDGRKYRARIPQINGGVREIEYQRDKNGIIIPPPIENGKLVDGSEAPAEPLRAKLAQRKIIAQYDEINLVRAEKEDFILKAGIKSESVLELANQGKLDLVGLKYGFTLALIMQIGLGDSMSQKSKSRLVIILNGLEKYGEEKLKLSSKELEKIKKEAEKDAQKELEKYRSGVA